jgi:small-conductance mechanosensitive channel
MTFLERLESIMRVKLVTLSGVPVTVASLLTCVAIFLISLLVARAAAAGVRRAINKRKRAPGVAAAVAKIVRYMIITVGLVVALDTLGLSLTAVVAGSAILLVGIGFGLQNIAQNFISGLILLVENPIREGDFIRAGEVYGTVGNIGLRGTRVTTRDGVTIIVPNSELVSNKVVNNSVPTTTVRVWVRVGVAYGSDVELVCTTLEKVARAHREVLADPAPEIRFTDFGNSSLDFALLVWINDPERDLPVTSDLRFAIDAAFRQAGITIPFPQRDLHVRSGLDKVA